MKSRWQSSSCALATVAGLAWGAMAFGAVYPWAYWPLLVACTAAGVLGLIEARRSARLNRSLAFGCAVLISAVLIQLVPLPRRAVAALSPSAEMIFSAQQFAPTPTNVGEASGTNEAGVAHALSVDPRATVRGLTFAVTWGLFLLGTARAFDDHQARRVARAILILGVALAVTGVVQKATASAKIYGWWQPYYSLNTAFGPFVNGNHFAGWMLMAIPVSMGYFCAHLSRSLSGIGASWRDRSLWLGSPEANQLILTAFGILLMTLSLMMTLSRSGIICLAIALLLVGSVIVRKQIGRPRQLLAVAGLLVAVSISIGWAGTQAVVDRFAADSTLDLGGRRSIWLETVRIIRAFPLVGTGLNTYATAALFAHMPDSHLTAVEAHSDYLQLAAEGGALLAGMAAFMLVIYLIEVRRRLRESPAGSSDYWIRLGAVTGLIAIGVQELAEFSLQMPGNAALFVVLCSLAAHSSASSGSVR